jgi:hypothetical protein
MHSADTLAGVTRRRTMAKKADYQTEQFIDIMAAYSAATTAAIQCLVVCLQNSGALDRGDYPETLRLYMEAQKKHMPDTSLALLHDLRMALLD